VKKPSERIDVHIRLDPALVAWLRAEAAADRRSLASAIEGVLLAERARRTKRKPRRMSGEGESK